MKIVFKRIAIGLVLCLAVVGAFALLRKAPDLNVSHGDHGYLEEVMGTKMHSSRPNETGLSSILNDSMQGVPQIGSDLGVGSSAPPSSFGLATAAPPYGSPSSEAPAFSASAASEAPPFLSEAPAFPTSAPQPVEAIQAPQYGAPYQEAPTFQPAPVPAPTPPDAPPISASPPPWGSGPAMVVATTPSSVPVEPRGASAVSDANTWVSPSSSPVPVSPPSVPIYVAATVPVVPPPAPPASPSGLVDPWPLEIIPAAERDVFSSNEVSSLEDALAPVPTSPPTPVSAPTVASEVVVVSPQAPPTHQGLEEKPLFVRPLMRRLPQVETPNPIAAIITESGPVVPMDLAATPEAKIPVPAETPRILPEDYRQTSIRNTMILTPNARQSEDAAAKISFSSPPQAKPEADRPAFSDPPHIAEAPTLPFVATEALPIEESAKQPERTIAVPQQSPTAVPSTILSRVPTPPEPVAEPKQAEIRATVRRFVESQRKTAASGDTAGMRNAYVQLSKLYDHPELNDEERNYLTPTLDRLALDVVFSCKNHLLEPAYVVQAGDTIDSIAVKYHLSPALLMKINGQTGARPLKPGTELKVVLGQFDAKLSSRRGELVLILGGLYAGRFPVTVGAEVANVRGEFIVLSKSDSYKGKTLTLSNGVKIRGADPASSEELLTDAFCLSQRDIAELFDILTERSVIVLED